MFEKVEPLDKKKHRNLKLTRKTSFNFARKIAMVPLGASELTLACRYYPIILPPQDGVLPQALLSLNKESNRYVNDEGKWLAPYVPAYLRRYPFTLAASAAAEADGDSIENFVVCIDPEAEHFKTDQGEPLLTHDGEPAAVTAAAIEFLKQYQADALAAEKFFTLLEAKDCLAAKELKVKDSDGEDKSLGAFRVVDQAKLAELDDATLAEWARSGLLNLVFAQNFSMTNLEFFTR